MKIRTRRERHCYFMGRTLLPGWLPLPTGHRSQVPGSVKLTKPFPWGTWEREAHSHFLTQN